VYVARSSWTAIHGSRRRRRASGAYAARVAGGEADAALVRDQPRVAGLVALELEVRQVGQLGHRPAGPEQVRVGGQGRRQLGGGERRDGRLEPARGVEVRAAVAAGRPAEASSRRRRRRLPDDGRRVDAPRVQAARRPAKP
jgi:hypothetical protein